MLTLTYISQVENFTLVKQVKSIGGGEEFFNFQQEILRIFVRFKMFHTLAKKISRIALQNYEDG